MNVNGMDPRVATGTEITAIDRRNITRVTTETRGGTTSIGMTIAGSDSSRRECPAMEERDERSEKVRITSSF